MLLHDSVHGHGNVHARVCVHVRSRMTRVPNGCVSNRPNCSVRVYVHSVHGSDRVCVRTDVCGYVYADVPFYPPKRYRQNRAAFTVIPFLFANMFHTLIDNRNNVIIVQRVKKRLSLAPVAYQFALAQNL